VVTIQTDLTQFNEDLALYARLARRTLQEATLKQGSKVVSEWRFHLKDIAPPKDVIRNAMLRHLKAGGGIYVRPSAYRRAEDSLSRKKGSYSDLITRKIMHKVRGGADRIAVRGKMRESGVKYYLNRQAIAVLNELGMRERARGFSSYGAGMLGVDGNSLGLLLRSVPADSNGGHWAQSFKGKVKQTLSFADVLITPGGQEATLRLVFGSEQTKLGTSLSLPPQQSLLKKAVEIVHEDMMVYVRDRLARAKADPTSKYAKALLS